MNLETHLNEVLEQLLSNKSIVPLTKEQLIHVIDLTLLEQNATPESLALLGDRAKVNRVAAVCVFAKHLDAFQQLAPVNLATVINFPEGNNELLGSLADIDQTMKLGAQEIDYVFPYQDYLQGNQQKALNHCDVVIQTCKKHDLATKVIIETGVFPNIESIYQLSKQLITLGCNFIKTSTGKVAQGASIPAVFAILSALNESETECGIKVSGGIKTPQQAQNYAHLAEIMLHKKINKEWFRIGASSLLSELLNCK